MRIALVYDVIYPYNKGGAEKRFYEIGRRLADRGHEVHLLGMKQWEGENIIKREGMYLHGIAKAMDLYGKDGQRSIKEAIYFGLNSLKLLRKDFEVIDCCAFPYFSLFSCKLASLLQRKPLFATWHEVWGGGYWHDYLGWKGFMGYMTERLAVLLPSVIISVSHHTTEKLRSELNSRKRIVTIPNGIELELIENIKPASEQSDVIYAGRLIEHKNIDKLIEAIGIVKEKIPGVKCLVIGDGPEQAALESLTQKLELTKNIKFLSFLEKQEEVYALLKASHVFVLPSIREGFGMAVIEAHACGIPVITTDYKDNAAKELIKEGVNGYILPLDVQKIAERILKILNNGLSEKMSKNCRESALKFDWDNIVTEIERVYGKE